MKLISLLLLCSFLLHANCTQKQMQEAQDHYNKAEFEKALKACYSAEIEANMLIVKAENELDVQKKIAFYKDALIAISKFSDEEVLVVEQNRLNLMLSKLYAPIDKELSDIYHGKIRHDVEDKEKSFLQQYGVYLFGFLMVLWALFGLFPKKP